MKKNIMPEKRRKFLQKTALGGFLAAFLPISFSKAMAPVAEQSETRIKVNAHQLAVKRNKKG